MGRLHNNSQEEIFICVQTSYFSVFFGLKAAKPPLIICHVSKKRRIWAIRRMAEHLGPWSSVWNPRADKQIKCGTAGEDRRETFKQISAHVEARGGAGLPKINTQTSFFFLHAAKTQLRGCWYFICNHTEL